MRLWRLAGWEFDQWSDPFCQLIVPEKMILLRLKSGGIGLFNDLFICIVILGVLSYYILNGALYVTWS